MAKHSETLVIEFGYKVLTEGATWYIDCPTRSRITTRAQTGAEQPL